MGENDTETVQQKSNHYKNQKKAQMNQSNNNNDYDHHQMIQNTKSIQVTQENEDEISTDGNFLKTVDLGDFEMIGILGCGSYGHVKLAKYIPTGKSIALKVISKEQVVRLRQKKQVLREKEIHRGLDHPCIAKLYKTLQDADCLYLLLEYLPGGELWSILYSEKSPLTHGKTGIHPQAVCFYAACLCLSLEYLHSNEIIYRDLKLENIVLDADGYPKLLDFGFAKIVNRMEENTTMCGSLEYMAPEILLHQPHGHEVDLWGFGIILYELLIGYPPFYDSNQLEQIHLITTSPLMFPEGFEEKHPNEYDLINKLLQKNPKDRPKSFSIVKKHPFFHKINWQSLIQHEIKAPFKANLKGNFDRSMFEIHDEDEADFIEPYEDDGSCWTKEF